MSFSSKNLGIFTQFSDTGLGNSQMKLDILGNLQTNVPQNLLKGVAVQKPIVGAVLSVNVTCQCSDYHYMFHDSLIKNRDKICGLNNTCSCAILFAGGPVSKIFKKDQSFHSNLCLNCNSFVWFTINRKKIKNY